MAMYTPDGRLLPHDLRKAPGLLEEGNIDLDHRPVVERPDGRVSTVVSTVFKLGDRDYAILPTVSEGGEMLSESEALKAYSESGKHLGRFSSAEAANDYAFKLHENQAVQYADVPYSPIEGMPKQSPVMAERLRLLQLLPDDMQRRYRGAPLSVLKSLADGMTYIGPRKKDGGQ